MQVLEEKSNRTSILTAATRALSHDAQFCLPEKWVEEMSLEDARGALNDRAFSHRFHAPDLLESFLNHHSFFGEERDFFKELERYRYHKLGRYFYQGTKSSLLQFCEKNTKLQAPFLKSLYAAVITFCEEEDFKNRAFSKKKALILSKIKNSLKSQSLFLEMTFEFFKECTRQDRTIQDKLLFSRDAAGDFKKKEKIKVGEPPSYEEALSLEPIEKKEEGRKGSRGALLQNQEKNSHAFFLEKKTSFLSSVGESLEEIPYKIFSQKYDEVMDASKLVSYEEKENLYSILEEKSDVFKTYIHPFSQKLYRFLKSQNVGHWRFHEEEGYLEGAHLPQVIIDPTYPYFYKSFIHGEGLNTAVTILVDNSGSMRGRPIMLAALSASFLMQTLEKCGIRVEILGFTTVSWKGGKSYQEWIQQGKTSFPGRLNDIRHIVYKSFSTPWQAGRRSLGVMMKEGILKENIDGEALLWAAHRLLKRQERRKILIVISDGASIDDMTVAHNAPGYLEAHLRYVVETLRHHPSLELFAIGIGHDVGRVYPSSITLKSAEELGKTLFEEFLKIFPKNLKEKRNRSR